jgi:hypothetical protein
MIGKAVQVCLMVLGFWLALTGTVAADELKVKNPLNIRINYSFQWQGGQWKKYTLDPKSVMTHTNAAGVTVAKISFDIGSKAARVDREYRLLAYKTYTFETTTLFTGERVLDLYARAGR